MAGVNFSSLFSLFFSGKSRILFPSCFHLGVHHEDHRLRLRGPSGRLPPERMESPRFHHRRYRVIGLQLRLVKICIFTLLTCKKSENAV